ncbi:GNAT family N-acetyltransferase [Brevibacillus sp. SYSU BS000544]|uniref:GNAT family N-acetyltransferase n=1 Tax=Brevibacillus sp. SYSU BS000544 TaxID=3416443 RepID=UPI003CE468D5
MELLFYQSEHDDVLKTFSLPEEQAQFTGLPIEVLDVTLADPNRHAICIMAEGVPVGFFVLHERSEEPPTQNPNALVLRAFSINYIHQGKGYAKAAMKLLPDFVMRHFPHIDEVVLRVNEKNHAAKQLYVTYGFLDNGLKGMGPIGPQSILQMPISTSNKQ